MTRILGMTTLVVVSLAFTGCEPTASNTNANTNANLRGTNTNTGYLAPANVAPGPMATSTPMMNNNMNSNMKSNMNGNSNSKMNSNLANKTKPK